MAPLIKSSSDKARSENIAEMIKSGHTPKQAEAAAYAQQREAEYKNSLRKQYYGK